MDETTPIAFLSYTHHDDEHDGGNITAFRKALEGEVRAQTGRRDVQIFQDRDAISWGQAWKRRIDNSLDAVTFLVPVVTPTYLNSAQCRRELRRFVDRERRLGRKDIILPVYWIETPTLQSASQQPPDDLARELAARQYTDWRELRFQHPTEPDARRALARLATYVRDALRTGGEDKRSTEAIRVGVLDFVRRALSAVQAGGFDVVGLVNILVDAVRDMSWLPEEKVLALRWISQSRVDRPPGALRESASAALDVPAGVDPMNIDGFQSRAFAVIEEAVTSTVAAAGDSSVASRLVNAIRDICILSEPANAGGARTLAGALHTAVEERLGVLRGSTHSAIPGEPTPREVESKQSDQPGFLRSRRSTAPTIEACVNPLDAHLGSLHQIFGRVFRSDHPTWRDQDPGDQASRLELLRHAVDAAAACEFHFSGDEARLGGQAGDIRMADLENLLRELASMITDSKSIVGYIGAEGGRARLLAVPLHHRISNGVPALVLVDPAPAFLDIGEPLATVLSTLWGMWPIQDPLHAEVAILTALRTEFGRQPPQLHHACLEAYSRMLESLVMVFEPVMVLSDRETGIGIHSWEALARRDSSARRAPMDALAIADAWGDQFIVQRDKKLAVKAITSYAEAHARGHWSQDNPKPVSINVSVRSLISDDYERTLAEAIADAGLAPHTVTLEISERDPIEPRPEETSQWQPTPIAHFQKRLEYLSRRLRVNFAVDDFGVGHSSLDRVSSLALTQIKVDRAILHHSMALSELDLVVQLAKDAMDRGSAAQPRVVVVEGLDADSPVSLAELYARDIHYVQGYITEEPASSDLRPLNKDLRRRIAGQLRAP